MADLHPLTRSTVAALRNTLDELPPDAVVVLSSDAEGNDFRPLDGVDPDAAWNVALSDIGDPTRYDGQNLLRAIVLFPQHR